MQNLAVAVTLDERLATRSNWFGGNLELLSLEIE